MEFLKINFQKIKTQVMLNKKAIFFILFSFFCLNLTAQVRITGTILSDATIRETLIGASIRVKNTKIGTVTDVEGKFSLEVPNTDGVLQVDYLGYIPQEIALNGRKSLEITLIENSKLLNETVVVGYGVQRKSDLTGAVGTIKTAAIERIPTASLDQAIQGKVAGVYVTPESGEPGKGATIRIRGTGTLNNSSPLYVVDGMLLDNISFLNPQDVESVEILKDASSTAIYGNRGANGVIIITTKKGKSGEKATISVGSYFGTQALTKKIPLANASEFAQMFNEYSGSPYYPNPAALGAGTDWQNVAYRDAPMSNVQLGINGGSEKYNYNLSANYFNQTGVLQGSEFERITVRFNNEFKVNNHLKIGNNLAFAHFNRQNAPGVLLSTLWMPPVFSEKDTAGKYSDPTFFGTAIGNPAAELFYKKNNFTKGNRLVGTVFGELNLLKYFTLRTNFGLDGNQEKTRFFQPIYQVSVSQRNKDDQFEVKLEDKFSWLWENTIAYRRDWEKIHLDAIAGYTAQEYREEDLRASRNNFPGDIDELLYLNAGNDTTQMNGGSAREWAMLSHLYRVNATFFDRYLLTASLRADGSSRFGKNNRWGYFPAVAVGWNLTNEAFMQNQKLLDRLKIRASWGITGNDKVGVFYPSLGRITGGLGAIFGSGENLNSGATLIELGNPDVRWENTKQTDIGLEIATLGGRLTLETDFYNRFTTGILYELPIPDYVGSNKNPVVNAAQVRNRGIDCTLAWRETRGKFSYNLGAIFSTVNNKVLKLTQGKSEIFDAYLGSGDPATRTAVGESIGAIYGYKVIGVYQNQADVDAIAKPNNNTRPGDLIYADLNNDKKIDAEDRTYLGSPIPKINYGFSLGMEWAGLDFAADIFGVSGNKVVNGKATSRYGVYNWEKQFYDNRWTGEGTSTTVPRVTNGGNNYKMSDFYVQDGSFLRLRSIALGYTLPKTWLGKLGVSTARFYVSGTNLWTKQAYTGYSPEFPGSSVFTAGVDNGLYPIAKTVLGGVNVTF
jgi:TonB-linked SusC/RagA family outer membrane protein